MRKEEAIKGGSEVGGGAGGDGRGAYRKEPRASELRFCSMAGHFRGAGKILPIGL